MRTKFLVVGFSDKTKCADFYREYIRKGNAKRAMRRLSGKCQMIVLREEKTYVDTMISTSTPIETVLQC